MGEKVGYDFHHRHKVNDNPSIFNMNPSQFERFIDFLILPDSVSKIVIEFAFVLKYLFTLLLFKVAPSSLNRNQRFE